MDNNAKDNEVKGAAVVPYCVKPGTQSILFLLGKECYSPRWAQSDRWGAFGGKVELRDECVEAAAARECYEETAGCVLSLPEWRNILLGKRYTARIEVHFRRCRYMFYLVPIDYRPYGEFFRRAKQFLQHRNEQALVALIEKSAVDWFDFNALKRQLLCAAPPSSPSQREKASASSSSASSSSSSSSPPPTHIERSRGVSPPKTYVNRQYGRRPLFRRKFVDLFRFMEAHRIDRYLVERWRARRPDTETPPLPCHYTYVYPFDAANDRV